VKSEKTEKYLLFIGRLVEKKGAIYLIESIKMLKDQNIRLLLIGEGEQKEEIEKTIVEKGMSERIRVMGSLSNSETLDILKNAYILCVPSVTAQNGDSEGLPTVILEAMACGTPVVAFDSAGISEAIENGVTGLLSEEKDVRGFADNIQHLLDSPDKYRDIAIKAKERCDQEFFIGNQIGKLEHIYLSAIENNRLRKARKYDKNT